MNIKFKLPLYLGKVIGKDLVGIKSDIDALRLPPKAKKLLHAIKEFVIQRLKILDEEIEKEEMASNKPAYILMDFTSHPLNIRYVNYSDGLKQRMQDSISKEDLIYLEKFGLK